MAAEKKNTTAKKNTAAKKPTPKTEAKKAPAVEKKEAPKQEITLEEALKRMKAAEAKLREQEEKQEEPAPIVIQTPPQKEPMVEILYIDSCIAGNQIPIGGGRIISGSGKRFKVTLSDFEGVFQTPLVVSLLKQRKFIVLAGLDEEQRVQYGVDYRDGEIIKNEGGFEAILNCDTAKAVQIFSDLCPSHRALVAARINGAHLKGDKRLTREKIEKLNDISKRDFRDGKGAFTTILQQMNEEAI